MSVDKYVVTKEDSGFSNIPHTVSQNLKDAEALGLWVYLQSLPPQWEFYKAHLRKHFGWGRDKLDKKIAILKAHNLVDIVGHRNEKGQFIEWNLHVKNGREFVTSPDPEIQNTENQCTGDDLSTETDLSTENGIQNTEKPAAGKPVTGFEQQIEDKEIHTKAIKEKSFCATAQKKPKSGKTKAEWAKENNNRPEWAKKMDIAAQSKEQMDSEAKHIAENEVIKRAPMPQSLKDMVKNMKMAH